MCLCVWRERGRKSSGGVGSREIFLYGRTLLIQTCKQEQLHTHKSQPFSDSPAQLPANRPQQLFSTSVEQISSKTHGNKSHCFQSTSPVLAWDVGMHSADWCTLRYSSPVSREEGGRKIFYFWNTQKPICGVEMILVNSTDCSLQAN